MKQSRVGLLGCIGCAVFCFGQGGSLRSVFVGTPLVVTNLSARQGNIGGVQTNSKSACAFSRPGVEVTQSQAGGSLAVVLISALVLIGGAKTLQNAEEKGWQRPQYTPPAARSVPVPDRATFRDRLLKDAIATGTRKIGYPIPGEDARFVNAQAKAGAVDANPSQLDQDLLPESKGFTPFTSPLSEKINGNSGLLPGRYGGSARSVDSLL